MPRISAFKELGTDNMLKRLTVSFIIHFLWADLLLTAVERVAFVRWDVKLALKNVFGKMAGSIWNMAVS